MPISSGALEWPASYYSKRERGAGKEGVEGALDSPRGAGNTPRGTAPLGYEWQPQLTRREDYEKWRKRMDKKDPLKTRSKKRRGCFGCLSSNKINKENEDPTNGEQRDSPREIIRRHRRRRCFLLALVVSLVAFLLLAVFVFVLLRFTGHQVIGPEDLVQCTGQWRSHFLAYAQSAAKGTVTYSCCYIPDIPHNTTVWTVLSQSGWPGGYLIPDSLKADCPAPVPNNKDCKDFQPSEFAKAHEQHSDRIKNLCQEAEAEVKMKMSSQDTYSHRPGTDDDAMIPCETFPCETFPCETFPCETFPCETFHC
ncbi:hypothetical protein ACOMHN_000240 [Nucella lapillus]